VAIDVADLVLFLFVAYGAAVVAVVYGFLHATASRQRVSREDPHGRGIRR
jgi:hypothetical protein